MRYLGLLLAALLMLLSPTLAQENDTQMPLIGWQDGMAVAWTSPDTPPEPLYPPDTPRIILPEMLSPDGRYVVYGLGDGISDGEFPRNIDPNGLVLHDLRTGEASVITPTTDDLYSWNAIWSPDADQLAWIRRTFEDDTETFRLEIYDIASGEITTVTDEYYVGFRDGGAGALVPTAPREWMGDTILQYSSSYVSSFDGFARIISAYNVTSGDVQRYTLRPDTFTMLPEVIRADGSRTPLMVWLLGFWFVDFIESTEDMTPERASSPYLRARNAPDDALTFLPHGDQGGYVNWLVQYPDGTLIDTDIIARWDEVYPTPDGRGLLYAKIDEQSTYVLWREDIPEDERLQWRGVPLWRMAEWFIPPECEPVQLRFGVDVAPTRTIEMHRNPALEPFMTVDTNTIGGIGEGMLCVDGEMWLNFYTDIDDEFITGWVRESDLEVIQPES